MPISTFDPATYSVWFATSGGHRLFPLDLALIDLEYARRVNGVGWAKIRYGLGSFDLQTLRVDSQIQIWRQPPAGPLVLETVCLLREWSLEYAGGLTTLTLRGPDQNDLLRRRIIAYFAGSEKAQTIDVATDDAMKDIFNENFLAGAGDTARDWSGRGVEVDGDHSEGNTIKKGYAWRNVLDLLQELNDQSRADGAEVFFNLEAENLNTTPSAVPDVGFVFKTYTNQPGSDKTFDTAAPAVFSPEWGTLKGAVLTYDYTDEVNFVYAAGQGEGQHRVTAIASDTDLIADSVFGRIEAFKDARNEETAEGVADAANSKLNESRPRVTFAAELIDVERMRYGVDWFLGDKVTTSVFGLQQDGIIRAVRVKVSGDGEETIRAGLESTEIVT